MGKVRTAKAKEELKAQGKQMARRKTLLEVREEAKEFTRGLRRNMDPAEAVQIILDNLMTSYEYASQKVFGLETDEYFEETISGKRLHPWIVEQERLGLQIVHVAGKAASMGLAERQIQLQEQQAAIFATVVEAALNAAGLNAETRRVVHEKISAQLEDIEATAVQIAA